jgi:hypothetical protein
MRKGSMRRAAAGARLQPWLPAILLVAVSLGFACASGGGRDRNRLAMTIIDVREQAVLALEQHGYTVTRGSRSVPAPERVNLTGERLVADVRSNASAVLVIQVALQRHGTGAEEQTSVSVTGTMRTSTDVRATNQVDRTLGERVVRQDAESVRRMILSAQTGWFMQP